MNIRLVEAEFFHAEVQTDMTKLIIAVRNFENVPKHWGTQLTILTARLRGPPNSGRNTY